MDIFSNMRFSAWRDGDRRMCCITGDVPGSKLRYISFYFTAEEFRDFAKGARGTFNDIAHNLYTFIDSCIFYDLQFPTSAHGVAEIPFVRATIPMFVRRILLGWAEKQWASETDHYERPALSISQERGKRWVRLYGLGTGQSKLKMNDNTKNFLEECLSKDSTPEDRRLRGKIDQLLTIAKNGTYAFFQTGYVDLSKDWDGFFFRIISPHGHCTMHGGVILHGDSGWSIHT